MLAASGLEVEAERLWPLKYAVTTYNKIGKNRTSIYLTVSGLYIKI